MHGVLDALPCGYLSFGDDSIIRCVNLTLLNMLGQPEDALKGQHFERLLSRGSLLFYQTHFFPLLKLMGKLEEVYLLLRTNAGVVLPVLANVSRSESDGEMINHCVFITIHQRNHFEDEILLARNELNREKKLLRTIVENIQVGVVACDINGNITLFNATGLEHLGFAGPVPMKDWKTHHTIYGIGSSRPLTSEDYPLARALQGENIRDLEFMLVPKNGSKRMLLVNGTALYDDKGNKTGAVIALNNITDRIDLELALNHQANHDLLTGLPNRRSFIHKFEQAVTKAGRNNSHLAIMFLDLDNFKHINDFYGHKAGDHLLKKFSKRLIHCVRKTDTVARLAGDEFVILVEELSAPKDEASHIAEKIISAMRSPIMFGKSSVIVSTSIGIAVFTNEGETVEELLHMADVAMYSAKRAGKNQYRVKQPDTH